MKRRLQIDGGTAGNSIVRPVGSTMAANPPSHGSNDITGTPMRKSSGGYSPNVAPGCCGIVQKAFVAMMTASGRNSSVAAAIVAPTVRLGEYQNWASAASM